MKPTILIWTLVVLLCGATLGSATTFWFGGTTAVAAGGPADFYNAIEWAFQGQWTGLPASPTTSFPNLGSKGGAANWGGGGTTTYACTNGDGTTDRAASISSALTSTDVYLPVGCGGGDNSYVVACPVTTQGIQIPSFRTLQCAPGATIKGTCINTHDTGIVTFASVTNAAVIGCTIESTNTVVPTQITGNFGNFGIWCLGTFGSGPPSNHILIKGNIVKNIWGDSAIRIGDEDGTVATDDQCNDVDVVDNTISANALYGVEYTNTTGARIIHNRFIDSSIGSEPTSNTDAVQTNVILAYNYVSFVNGNCNNGTGAGCVSWTAASNAGNIYFGTGENSGFGNYSTNQVYGNYVTGSTANNKAQFRLDESTSTVGTFTNNVVANGANCVDTDTTAKCGTTQ